MPGSIIRAKEAIFNLEDSLNNFKPIKILLIIIITISDYKFLEAIAKA